MELLAILGRGIQRVTSDGPWVLTEDLEMCDEKGAHLAVRESVMDMDNPRCLIGGGELNLLAGVYLCVEYLDPLKMVACAYGQRSPYLRTLNAPSESEVMTNQVFDLLLRVLPILPPKIARWDRDRTIEGPPNTNRELQNIFELSLERNYTKIGIVTVQVHYARALLMAQRQLMKPEFSHLELQFFASEDVLLKADPEKFGPRIRAMHGSKAFMRNFSREVHGINALLAGSY